MACKYTYKGVEYTEDEFRKVLKSMPQQELGKYLSTSITPSAPFVTSTDAWVELGLKQAIRMAVDGGYNRIAWTSGDQQNERYDLSKQVKSVDATRYDLKETGPVADVRVIGLDGKQIHSVDGATHKELTDLIGKELADRIMAQEPESRKEYSGDGLKVGGSGMKGFYDKILPAVAKKVSKKLGGDGVVEAFDIGIREKGDLFTAEDARIVQRGGVYQVIANGQVRGGNHNSRQDAEAYIRSMSSAPLQQSIAITPEMRARVGLGMPLMQRPKTTKAKEWNAAVDDAVANNLSKGPEQAIADAAELITDPDGKQAFIDAMNAAWGVTTPPLGTKANQKKVSKVLLREELNKAVEAGKRAGIADVAKARKAFVEQIKEAISKDNLKGALTEAQARSITSRAASVNPINPKAVDRFIAYAERIANDATQAAKEADAKKLRKRIRTAIKGKADERRDAMVNDLAGEFASLNVSDIDLDEYIALGERLLKTLQGTRVKVGDTAVTAIGMDEAVTNAEVQEYVDRQRAKEQAAAEAEAIEEFEAMREALGVDEASMTTEELEALIESISGIKARTEAIEKLSKDKQKTEMLRTMARSKLKELEGYAAFRNRDSDTAISKERMKTVADLGKIDIGKLNGEEATYLITAVNNIMLNDRWGGTRDFAAKGRAEEGFAIIDKAFAGLKRIGRPGEENKLFNLTDSTELMAEKIARGPTAAAKFMRAIGMHEWLSSISSAKRRLDESVRRREEYARSIGFSMTKDDTILNRYRMGFYAYLIQHKGGTAEQIQEQFNKRAYNVRKSIERMKDPDKLSHLKRNEGLYIKAAEDVLGDAENASQLTIDPKLRKMVEFQIKENARLKEETFIAAEDDHNKVLKAYENWTPQRSVASDASVKADQQKDLFEERMWGNRLVDSTPSSSKMDRSDTLLDGHIINPDFFAVQDESMFETLADNLGAQHLATLREAINDPRMRKLVGSSTVKMLQDRVRSIKGLEASKGDLLSGSLAKLYHTIAKRSMQIALKGIAQAPKQATVGFATAISLGKDMDLLPEGYADAVKAYYGEGKGSWQYELIKDEQIHERGKTLAGLEKIGDPIARTAVLTGRENDAKAMAKVIAHRWSTIADKGMIPLAFVDSLSASAAWFAFYKKKLRDKGVDLKSDAWKYEKDVEAAAYANQMVSRQQNANAVESMAQIYREKGGWRIVVDVAFAFSSFAVNMRKRLARDIQTLRTGAKEDRAYAARDLAGAVVETAAFSMISYFIAAATKQAYDKLADEMYGEDDDEERIPEDWWKEVFGRAAFDLLFGGIPESIGNIPKSGINEAANAIAKHYGTTVRNDGKDLFYIPREAGYGKFGSIIDTASNAYAGLASWAKGQEEGRDLSVLSLLSLVGASDQTITRTFERELRKRVNAKSRPDYQKRVDAFKAQQFGERMASATTPEEKMSIRAEFKQWTASMDEAERTRLERVADKERILSSSDPLVRQLSGIGSPEERAEAAWEAMKGMSPEGRRDISKQMKAVPGLVSERFVEHYRALEKASE